MSQFLLPPISHFPFSIANHPILQPSFCTSSLNDAISAIIAIYFFMIFGKRRTLAHVRQFRWDGSWPAPWFLAWSEVLVSARSRQVNSETFNTQFLPLARLSFANRFERRSGGVDWLFGSLAGWLVGWPRDWARGQNCVAIAFVVARLRQVTSLLKLGDF